MRKIHFAEDEIWKYKIGREFVEIRDPQNKKFLATKTHLLRTVLGKSVSEAYKEVYSEFFGSSEVLYPEVKPSYVKSFIQKEIKDDKNFIKVK